MLKEGREENGRTKKKKERKKNEVTELWPGGFAFFYDFSMYTYLGALMHSL